MPRKYYNSFYKIPYCNHDSKDRRIQVKQTKYKIQKEKIEKEITEALNGKPRTNTINDRL